MSVLSFIALILLSLMAYSGGVVGKAGKSSDIKPQIIDLFLIMIIWAGAIYSRLALDFNKWLLILVWIFIGVLIGIISAWPRHAHETKLKIEPKKMPSNHLKRYWQSWKDFSFRMGGFQSRILLSLFFFVFVTPAALAVKIFSDPLRIKSHRDSSHWLPKKEIINDLEEFRRQF